MFRRIASMSALIPLVGLGWLLSAGPAAAQNQGYSAWLNRGGGGGGGGGWRSSGSYAPPSPTYYQYTPAYTAGVPVVGSQSSYTTFYYSPAAAAPINNAVTINVDVPADARIWFDGSKTVQSGTQRQFVSPPLERGPEYKYDVEVKWKHDGREVTNKRRITVHAGDVVHLTFPRG